VLLALDTASGIYKFVLFLHIELMKSGGDRAEIERRARLAGTVGPILSLIVAVILFLMVFKPGAPGS
jgi:hypothetical protein